MTRYISMFSGIEAASVAFGPLGWEPICFAEIDPFPAAVLAHHYPGIPNVGDVTAHDWTQYRNQCDLVVAGPPCQSFSVAGLRQSLDDHRGNLSLVHMRAIHAIDPRWTLTENVPGWLSTRDNAFGCFLAGLVGADAPLQSGQQRGRWTNAGVVSGPRRTAAWRVLDAQYFGLAQRRERVFVLSVRGAGNWACADALFPQSTGLHGHTPPRREAGQGTAGTVTARAGNSSRRAGQHGGLIHCADAASTLDAHYGDKMGLENQHIDHGAPLFVAHALRADGFDASEDGTGRGTPLVPVVAPCLTGNYGKQPDNSDTAAGPMLIPAVAQTVTAEMYRSGGATAGNNPGVRNVVAVDLKQVTSNANRSTPGPVSPTLHQEGTVYAIQERAVSENPENGPHAFDGYAVRRLTPRECERLQGFPDDYTLIPYRGKPAKDGPRYKALGNSMAVNVMRWLGSRIALVEASAGARAAAPERVA